MDVAGGAAYPGDSVRAQQRLVVPNGLITLLAGETEIARRKNRIIIIKPSLFNGDEERATRLFVTLGERTKRGLC